MNPDRIPELIARIALADPRVRRNDEAEQIAQIDMWAGILAHVPYEYALKAAHKHYAVKAWPILPADIATQWQADVRDRMNRDIDPVPPADPDDEQAYRDGLTAHRQAVAHGHTPPTGHRELTAVPPEVQQRLDQIGQYIPPAVRQQLAKYRPTAAKRDEAVAEGRPDPLAVPCPWCNASVNQHCRGRRTNPNHHDPETKRAGNRPPHPARLDAAARATAA